MSRKHLGVDGRTLCGAPFSKMTSTQTRARVTCSVCATVISEMRAGRVGSVPEEREELFLDATETGQRVGLSAQLVGKMWKRGFMPHERRGNRLGIRASVLDTWIQARAKRSSNEEGMFAIGQGEPAGSLRGLVYAVQWAGQPTAPIKIGFTTHDDVDQRVRGLQTGSPYRLHVLGTMAGTFDSERQIHVTFAADRLEGEWFAASPAVLEWVANLRVPFTALARSG